MGYEWHFEVVWNSLPFLLKGLIWTFLVSITSMASGLILGLLLSLARISKLRWISLPALSFIEFFRGTPFLIQLMWVYYSLPIIFGITLSSFVSAFIALTLNLSAFNAEAFRAGIQSIERDQREAALALGMANRQVMWRIIIPQAIRRVVPPLGSTWVSLFKDTAICSVVAVHELMYNAKVLAIESFRPVEVYTIVALIYFIITYPQARYVDFLYDRFRVRN